MGIKARKVAKAAAIDAVFAAATKASEEKTRAAEAELARTQHNVKTFLDKDVIDATDEAIKEMCAYTTYQPECLAGKSSYTITVPYTDRDCFTFFCHTHHRQRIETKTCIKYHDQNCYDQTANQRLRAQNDRKAESAEEAARGEKAAEAEMAAKAAEEAEKYARAESLKAEVNQEIDYNDALHLETQFHQVHAEL